jgi:uncharacterized membrane protein YdbT with pleckstrin-like domain
MAGYVDKVLEPGERISYRGKLSAIAYVPGLVVFIIGIVIAAVGVSLWFILYLGLLVALVGLVILIRLWILRATTEIAVTDRRVILKRGLISRRTLEMNLTRIESVDVRQGILGRLLNYGDVMIRGTGSGMEPIKMIDAPIEFRRRVLS